MATAAERERQCVGGGRPSAALLAMIVAAEAERIKGGYNDPDAEGNGPHHHTGKRCIESGCTQPAGTGWSPLWCFAHNVARMDRISAGLVEAMKRFERTDADSA